MPRVFSHFVLCGLLVTSVLFAATKPATNISQLENFQIIQNDQTIKIVCDFTKKISYHSSQLSDPFRIVLDFDSAKLSTKLPKTSADVTILKGIRSSVHEDKFLRIVLDLDHQVQYETHLETEASKAHFIIELHDQASQKLTGELLPEPTAVKLVTEIVRAKEVVHAKEIVANNSRNITIVIDPGHGGKDPGAAGPHGTQEKDVVLKISKELQQLINEEPGFCAVLTRDKDYYISLRKRLAIARKNHADMFIAVHADAYTHDRAVGASVYALSQRGATSEAARWLAEKENESELGGLSSELADKDAILRSVLIDLSQTHTIEASLQIGHAVLQQFSKFSPLHHPHVEQAAFVVLKSPDIPSILVETGFLSNPNEEVRLADKHYQYQAALAIKQGIKQYFELNPPSDTWFSERHSKKQVALKK